MGVCHVRARIYAYNFIPFGSVHIEFSIIAGVSELQAAATIDRSDKRVGLGIHHRQLSEIAINHENMAAGWIKDDTVRVDLSFDLFEHLERRQVENNNHARFAVIRITLTGGVRHGNAMRTAGHPLDSTNNRAVVSVNNRNSVAVRDKNSARIRIEHDVIPAVRRAQRNDHRDVIVARFSS